MFYFTLGCGQFSLFMFFFSFCGEMVMVLIYYKGSSHIKKRESVYVDTYTQGISL